MFADFPSGATSMTGWVRKWLSMEPRGVLQLAQFGNLRLADALRTDIEADEIFLPPPILGEEGARLVPLIVVDPVEGGRDIVDPVIGFRHREIALRFGQRHMRSGRGGDRRKQVAPAHDARGRRIGHRLAAARVRIAEDRKRLAIHGIGRAHRRIGRERCRRRRRVQRALGPALIVIGVHDRKNPHFANPPDAVLLDVAVLENRQPHRGRAAVGIAQHGEFDAARMGLHPAGRDGDQRVGHDVIVELAVQQSCRAVPFQCAADALHAAIDARSAISSVPSSVKRSVTSSHILRST